MSLSLVLALLALAASLYLLFQPVERTFSVIALVVSGAEVLMATGILRLGLKGVPLGLVLGATLAIAGVILFTRASAKFAVAATTSLALVGAVQLLGALKLAH